MSEAHPSILVVEDDLESLDLLCEILRTAGYETVEAASGRLALEKLRAGPLPALVLLDLMMPGMNGWEVMDEIRGMETLASVPVVLVSAHSGLAEAARSLGVAGYLHKPASLQELLDMVARHARQ